MRREKQKKNDKIDESSKIECMIEQSTEAINIITTPGTALGPWLSAEVSYFSVSLSVWPPTLINWKPKTHI